MVGVKKKRSGVERQVVIRRKNMIRGRRSCWNFILGNHLVPWSLVVLQYNYVPGPVLIEHDPPVWQLPGRQLVDISIWDTSVPAARHLGTTNFYS